MSKYIIKTAIEAPDKPIEDIDKLFYSIKNDELATAIKDNLIYYKLRDNKEKLNEYTKFLNERTYINKLKTDVRDELKKLFKKSPPTATINTLLNNINMQKVIIEETEMSNDELTNLINNVQNIEEINDDNISISDSVKTSLTNYKELNDGEKEQFIGEFIKEVKEPIFDKLINAFSYLKWDEFKQVLEINKKVVMKFIGIGLFLLISSASSGGVLSIIIKAIIDQTKKQYNDEKGIKNYNLKK